MLTYPEPERSVCSTVELKVKELKQHVIPGVEELRING